MIKTYPDQWLKHEDKRQFFLFVASFLCIWDLIKIARFYLFLTFSNKIVNDLY